MRFSTLGTLAAVLAAACSRESPPAAAAEARSHAPVVRLAVRTPRVANPEVDRLRRCLDRGAIDEARSLLRILEHPDPGWAGEAALLSARFSALSENVIDAIRTIEAARKEHPTDPDVYATAAEIYAAAGKLDTAWDEVKAGEAGCGSAPELTRARGVLWISRSGGARKGLELLEEARRGDPGLPFLDRALSQAHLLVGKEDSAAGKSALALSHARSAATFDPEDVEVRRFLSEALVENGDLEAGIAEIETLVERGEPLSAELAMLHKKAGIAALLHRDRSAAVLHFAAARRLGAGDDELSTGARILDEEAAARVEAGVAAYKAGDLAAAKVGFQGALELDADRIQAKNHLAVVLFKEADYSGAAALWKSVLEIAARESLDLPEPVHVNLAQAQVLGGDVAGARNTLETYLERDPEGRWSSETRTALSALPAKKSSD